MLNKYANIVGVTAVELTGRVRNKHINDARGLCWFVMKNIGLSYSEIARLFNCNHSTILSGCKRIKYLIEIQDKDIVNLINKLNMSELKQFLEITPEGIIPREKNGRVYTVHGFTCTNCSGNGHFYSIQISRNEYEKNQCPLCKGRGKLQAKIVVGWLPDDEA